MKQRATGERHGPYRGAAELKEVITLGALD